MSIACSSHLQAPSQNCLSTLPQPVSNPVGLERMVALVVEQSRAVCCACWVALPHCYDICQRSLFNFLAAPQHAASISMGLTLISAGKAQHMQCASSGCGPSRVQHPAFAVLYEPFFTNICNTYGYPVRGKCTAGVSHCRQCLRQDAKAGQRPRTDCFAELCAMEQTSRTERDEQ